MTSQTGLERSVNDLVKITKEKSRQLSDFLAASHLSQPSLSENDPSPNFIPEDNLEI